MILMFDLLYSGCTFFRFGDNAPPFDLGDLHCTRCVLDFGDLHYIRCLFFRFWRCTRHKVCSRFWDLHYRRSVIDFGDVHDTRCVIDLGDLCYTRSMVLEFSLMYVSIVHDTGYLWYVSTCLPSFRYVAGISYMCMILFGSRCLRYGGGIFSR